MNKKICDKCCIELQIQEWLKDRRIDEHELRTNYGPDYDGGRDYILKCAKEHIELNDSMSVSMGHKGIYCGLKYQKLKEPPEDCLYLLEQVVSSQKLGILGKLKRCLAKC